MPTFKPEDLLEMGRDPETGERIDTQDQTDAPEVPSSPRDLQQPGLDYWQTTGETCAFTLLGRPVPWERRISTKKGVDFLPAKVKDYERRVYARSKAARPSDWTIEGWYRLHATFVYPDQRFADITNLLKIIEDGINGPADGPGSLWTDDRRVADTGHTPRICVPSSGDGYTEVIVERIITNGPECE